jgi:peptide chain release factor 2
VILLKEQKPLGGIFDFDLKKERLEEILRELESAQTWQNPEKVQSLGQEKSSLEQVVNKLETLKVDLADAKALLEMAEADNDEDAFDELNVQAEPLKASIEELEFQRMFCGEMDAQSCFLEVQSGSGGTEAQDWAEMLLRMYTRWAEHQGFQVTLLESQTGDVAGIKSATLKIEGSYAFGWLRTETGVHRLVRKSPFDSGNRRHTSFAAIFISPIIDDNVEIVINPAELRIDTYRSSGAGGQHVNKTDSAIRITHLPTGIVVQCQNDRSQHKNRAQAMSQLKAKLYELEMRKKREAQQALEETKSDIGWGSQIRSYVLDDARIKDLRTGLEFTNTQTVLDGGKPLTEFMMESLKQGL